MANSLLGRPLRFAGGPTGASIELVRCTAPLRSSDSFQQVVIIRVRSDPEPRNLIALDNTNRTVIDADSSRIDRPCRMDAFEVHAGMIRIPREQCIRLPGLGLHGRRQRGVTLPEPLGGCGVHKRFRSRGDVLPWRFSSRASSASFSRTSSDSANCFAHCLSECSSSSIHLAKAFCSTSGSRDASSNALSSKFVIIRVVLRSVEYRLFEALLQHETAIGRSDRVVPDWHLEGNNSVSPTSGDLQDQATKRHDHVLVPVPHRLGRFRAPYAPSCLDCGLKTDRRTLLPYFAAAAMPHASSKSAVRCVFSHVNSGSQRPKCPPAAVSR